jgi:hypothetical protein
LAPLAFIAEQLFLWRLRLYSVKFGVAYEPARTLGKSGRRFGLPLFLLILAGCSSIGPTVIPRDRTDYLSAVAESWKQQTLLNAVRLRYGDSPAFLDISSVVSSYTVQGQVSVGGTFSSDLTATIPRRVAAVGAGVTYQDRPTISYTPLSGDKFTKNLMRPVPPSAIFQLVQAGYAADLLLRVTVRSLNGISNRLTSGAQTHPADPQFYPLLDAMRRLQTSNATSLRLEKRGREDFGMLVLTPNRTPEVNRDLEFLRSTLRLKPGKHGELSIVFGAVQRNQGELAVLSRSMLEILIELASGIEVPADHVDQRRTMASGRVATAEDPRDRPLVRIMSGSNPPAGAFVVVSYRNTWYWIDDNDINSKRIFSTLMLFFSLAETGVTPQAPALTVPVN